MENSTHAALFTLNLNIIMTHSLKLMMSNHLCKLFITMTKYTIIKQTLIQKPSGRDISYIEFSQIWLNTFGSNKTHV